MTAAVLVVLAYLATLVEFGSRDADRRPVGKADDIQKLKQRDDLNVLFFLVDTLRSDRTSAYGYSRNTTPRLASLASQGVRFGQHLAQSSWTKCSMASLWTGLYPARTGVTRFEHVLTPDAVLPAEIMKDAGFRTVGIWRNGWVEGYFGFDQGFDVYTRPLGSGVPPAVRRENPTVKGGGTDMDAVNAAIEFLRVSGHERWFLYLHLMDVHEYLYDEESALFGSTYSDVYDNAIRHEDYVFGQLYDHLAQQGHLENTLIIVGSDHGEAFRERGFEGHARRVYRETTEVPWLLSFPFRLEPGVVVESRSENVDLWPTVLDVLGLPSMSDVNGRSRLPQILAATRGHSAAADDPPAYAHLDQNWGQRGKNPADTVAVSEGDYRYVVTWPKSGFRVHELFERLPDDTRELQDVGKSNPEVVSRMGQLAREYLESKPPWDSTPEDLELDEIQLNQLRALGYAIP